MHKNKYQSYILWAERKAPEFHRGRAPRARRRQRGGGAPRAERGVGRPDRPGVPAKTVPARAADAQGSTVDHEGRSGEEAPRAHSPEAGAPSPVS